MIALRTLLAALAAVVAMALQAPSAPAPAPAPAVPAAPAYAGVWSAGLGTAAQEVVPARPWTEFAQAAKACRDRGLQLVATGAYYDRRTETSMYAGVWRGGLGGGEEETKPAMAWQQLAAENLAFVGRGFRLVALSLFNRNGQIAYVASWRAVEGDAQQWLFQAQPWDGFAARDRTLVAQGLRLTALAAARDVDGEPVYAGVWRGGQGSAEQAVEPGLDADAFRVKDGAHAAKGLHLVSLAAFLAADGRPCYAGVWRAGGQTGGPRARPVDLAADWTGFAAANQRRLREGFRLVAFALLPGG